jgi:hypothetical protein
MRRGASRDLKNFSRVDAVRVRHLWIGCLKRGKADIVSGRDGVHGVTGLYDICHEVRGDRRWVVNRSV